MHTAEGDRVFDRARRRWVALTPEEWVRQHMLNHLVEDLGCPLTLIAVERALVLNGLNKRADIVVYGAQARALLLIECKAPRQRMDQRVFEQAARYNMVFKVPYLVVTNGLVHYACRIDHASGTVHFLSDIPTHAGMHGIPPA